MTGAELRSGAVRGTVMQHGVLAEYRRARLRVIESAVGRRRRRVDGGKTDRQRTDVSVDARRRMTNDYKHRGPRRWNVRQSAVSGFMCCGDYICLWFTHTSDGTARQTCNTSVSNFTRPQTFCRSFHAACRLCVRSTSHARRQLCERD